MDVGLAAAPAARALAERVIGRDRGARRNVAADTAYLGDLSRAVFMYERQGLTGESSRDAEFALDNTLFRFGWRYDVAVVEPNQVKKFTGA